MIGRKIAIAYVVSLALTAAAPAQSLDHGGALFGIGDVPTSGDLNQVPLPVQNPERARRAALVADLAGCAGGPTGPLAQAPSTAQFMSLMSAFDGYSNNDGRPDLPTNEAVQQGRARLVDVFTQAERVSPGTAACYHQTMDFSIQSLFKMVPPNQEAVDAIAGHLQMFLAARDATIAVQGLEWTQPDLTGSNSD